MGDKSRRSCRGQVGPDGAENPPFHGPLCTGFGIARRIEQLSEDVLQLNEGTVYTALLRLQQQGWIASERGHVGERQSQGAVLLDQHRRGKKQLEG